MIHPGLHGYLAEQHQRELERSAERERFLTEARQTVAETPSAAGRLRLNAGRWLIDLGQRLCTGYPAEQQRAVLRAASRDMALSPLSTWTPAMLARIAGTMETVAPMSFVYYGFVTVGPRGVTRAEYVTPLAYAGVGGRVGAGERG